MSWNADALMRIIADFVEEFGYIDMGRPDKENPELAEWLASRGVLAVDALDEQQLHRVAVQGIHLDVEPLRAALRRCATGDAEV